MASVISPYSNLKVFAHPDRLDAIARGERRAPLYVFINPTNVCDHRCFYCSYHDADLGLRDVVCPGDQIPWSKMKEIIADLSAMDVKAVTLSGGGEPLVYPNILETLDAVLQAGIDLSMLTNGNRLTGDVAKALAKAKWLRVSFDAADANTYEEIRGLAPGGFAKVCQNITDFAQIKDAKCELGINFVVHHQNAHQIFQAAKLVKELGANHIKICARVTADLLNYHQSFKEMALAQIRRAEEEVADETFAVVNKYEDDFKFSLIFNRVYQTCYIKDLVTVIAADCKVYFCHDKAYVSSGEIGSIAEESFQSLWFAPETSQRFSALDAHKECQHHCVYDDRNILLNSYFGLDFQHINFI